MYTLDALGPTICVIKSKITEKVLTVDWTIGQNVSSKAVEVDRNYL